jgi:hypothetical protein
VQLKDKYDVIVAGGGVAGVAAAVAARRQGKRTLIIEKALNFGGLATNGLINLFVPMCNGRGVQIIKGMCDELVDLAVRYGYDTIPEEWREGQPKEKVSVRYLTRFSPAIFSLAIAEFLQQEQVDIFLDTTLSNVVMDGNRCKGVILHSRSGDEYYEAEMFIDATGDGELMHLAGVPTVDGLNYFTYVALGMTLDSCRQAAESGNIAKAQFYMRGGPATLYGTDQPEGERLYTGNSKEDVTEYILRNQKMMLDGLRNDDRFSRDIAQLPSMPQFRETRRMAADYVMTEDDVYRHFDDSISAICDFDHRDKLYEVPYRTLVNSNYPNIITAGRSAAAEGYTWDVLRVIPPAIMTGQAAGNAVALAIDEKTDIARINISALQSMLEKQNVMIHFDDALVPENPAVVEESEDIGHI